MLHTIIIEESCNSLKNNLILIFHRVNQLFTSELLSEVLNDVNIIYVMIAILCHGNYA